MLWRFGRSQSFAWLTSDELVAFYTRALRAACRTGRLSRDSCITLSLVYSWSRLLIDDSKFLRLGVVSCLSRAAFPCASFIVFSNLNAVLRMVQRLGQNQPELVSAWRESTTNFHIIPGTLYYDDKVEHRADADDNAVCVCTTANCSQH